MFGDFLDSKQTLTDKNVSLILSPNWIFFLEPLTHDFGQTNLEFFHPLFLAEKCKEIIFGDVPTRKHPFKDYKNFHLIWSRNWIHFKHDYCILLFFFYLFFFYYYYAYYIRALFLHNVWWCSTWKISLSRW